MSIATFRLVQTIPVEGLTFALKPGLEINSLVPLGEGVLRIAPASPLDGQTVEEITITADLVGCAIPGAGAVKLEAGSTAVPLFVAFGQIGDPMQALMVPSTAAGGGLPAGASTEAKQDDQIVQFATLISNTTGGALDATVQAVKDAIDSLKGNGVDNATHYDILFELQTRGAVDTDHLLNIEAASSDSAIKLDSIFGSTQLLETYTDGLEGLSTDANTKLDDIKTAVDTARDESTRVTLPPTIWKKYAAIPSGGLNLGAQFPGKIPVRVETYGDGLLDMRPAGDAGNIVSADSFYGWTWLVTPDIIEDTTTALPLIVYWS